MDSDQSSSIPVAQLPLVDGLFKVRTAMVMSFNVYVSVT